MFLGYNIIHKGYKCKSLISEKIFFNIIFNENCFPYKDNAGYHTLEQLIPNNPPINHFQFSFFYPNNQPVTPSTGTPCRQSSSDPSPLQSGINSNNSSESQSITQYASSQPKAPPSPADVSSHKENWSPSSGTLRHCHIHSNKSHMTSHYESTKNP